MRNWKAVLQREFNAEEGSFLILLRTRGWDWQAYHRLFDAMLACCKAIDGHQRVERWIANGFWFLSWYTKQEMETIAKSDEAIYNALVNLDHLAFWFFIGEGRRDDEFEPLLLH